MPNWLSQLFATKSPQIFRALTKDGVVIRFDDHAVEADALTSAQALGYVQQLAGEERFIETDDGMLLPWDEVYKILDEPQGAEELEILAIPRQRQLSPSLRSENTLTSPEFIVAVDGWRDQDRRPVDDVSISRAVAFVGNETALLPRASYELMRHLAHFYDKPQRDEKYNRRAWGELRKLAVAAGAALDQFLFSNVIVTPERLAIQLGRCEPGGVSVVEIEPWFAGAPDTWLQHFDGFAKVRDLYEIPTQDGIVQVIVTPKVKAVLEAIKQMPGRRVAGTLAERFVSNPFATLGAAAGDVIDSDQFEQARDEAGIALQCFTARVTTDTDGYPSEVGVRIESTTSTGANSAYEKFSDARELGHFINGIQSRLKTGGEIFFWRGYDLQLLGNTPREVETLTLAFNAWTKPRITIRYADVADLRRYSERVMGIGVQKPLISPYIRRGDDEDSWFPNIPSDGDSTPRPVVAVVQSESGTCFDAVVTPEVAQEIKARIERAKATKSPTIEWPELVERVPLEVAEETIAQAEQNWPGATEDGGTTDPSTARRSRERKELLLRANVESAEYLESRNGILHFDTKREPHLPSSLNATVKLKDHQVVGIAWMQNLIEQAPDYCRGAVLADDMGLGKTLQLLAVIARMLEDNPTTAPILIVAPVSLLENWKEEAQRFFAADIFKMLMLYGDDLSKLRETPTCIEDQLRSEGMVRFLKPGWLGNHKVVLTTYETLRDLEFSLAPMRWSLMVCDEAQKIKNPAAMVTRAAKKQNVAFKIACTGTPVENSLADLWCLFDYVQPGLLGALNEFCDKYRRPIECKSDPEKERVEELRGIVEPQLLRRTKKDVAKDLPTKVIDDGAQKLPISPLQRKLYGEALELFKMRRDPARYTPFKSHLGLLHYLRLLCTDPRKYSARFNKEKSAPTVEHRRNSPKLNWLLGTLERVREKKEKAIVFCEFRDMQQMLAHYIEETFHYKPDIIKGDDETSMTHARSRQKRIKAFQEQPGFGVIVLSPLAVGFGVNIQAANHVIHFTRTWNPAKEDQATDRAYRIGQTKTVYVYYPVVRAEEFKTFDVKLNELLDSKRRLSGDILNGAGNVLPNEFDDVIGVGGNVFEDRITIDDATQLQPEYFEAFTAALWKKRGFRTVIVTSASNDHGVDVVAKTQRNGELIQCKSSTVPGKQLDWDAVKDVVTGHAAYKIQYPGTQFKLVCVTNQYFNDNTQRMAKLNNVELIDQSGLQALLDEHRVTFSEIEMQIADRH